jgi:hypothetical protein
VTTYENTETFRVIHYISPVFTLTIGGAPSAPPPPPLPPPAEEPPPPTLGLAEAYAVVKRIIRHKTGQRPFRLKAHCNETSAATATCKVSWITPAQRIANVSVYAGTFHLVAEAGEEIGYSFKGARARYRCLKRHGVSACASRVRW